MTHLSHSVSLTVCLVKGERDEKRSGVCVYVCVYLTTDGSWLAGLRQGNYHALCYLTLYWCNLLGFVPVPYFCALIDF